MRNYPSYPPLLLLAMVLLPCGLILLLSGQILTLSPDKHKGLLLIAIGMLLFGVGEILNHPAQTHLEYSDLHPEQPDQSVHRRRNPCSLGNLMVILSLLAFFMGSASFISF